MADNKETGRSSDRVEHVEVQGNETSAHSAKVISVALADAVAKDSPETWSSGMVRLYAIMLLVTISEYMIAFPVSTA